MTQPTPLKIFGQGGDNKKGMTKQEILDQLQKENPTSIPVFKAMEAYAKQQIFAYLEFREQYIKAERARIVEEALREKRGLPAWTDTPDEIIYEKFLTEQQ
jgi:hypothetical protein